MKNDHLRKAFNPSLRDWLRFIVILGLFLAISSAGYTAFRNFVSASNLQTFNLYLVALGAGVASFFSPCAFPLLPSYFSFYQNLDLEEQPQQNRPRQALRLGLSAASGVISFNMGIGAIIAVLSAGVAQGRSIADGTPNPGVIAFRFGTGVLLLILGFGQLRGWNLKPRFVDAFVYRTRPQRAGKLGPASTLYLYGLGYTAAGIGCTGPILAGLIAMALSSGGFPAAAISFVIFSLTMGMLMFIVSMIVSTSRQTLITRIKVVSPIIKRASGVLLVLVASFQLYSVLNLESFITLLFP